MNWLEKEEAIAEYNKELRELHRSYAQQAKESAQEEYDKELERW